MTIPQIYVKLGLASPDEVWVVDGAMYGLATSPRDWSDHRDDVLPKLTWKRSVRPGEAVSVKGDSDRRTCQFDRCYRTSLEPGSPTSLQQTWLGRFRPSVDQHLWHLEEECAETGAVVQRGLMAIYVDDVLLAAEEHVGELALQAISEEWECAAAVIATESQPISFCGFEIQKNEDGNGGGFRMHQRSYEEDLVQKWGVEKTAWQINIKLHT